MTLKTLPCRCCGTAGACIKGSTMRIPDEGYIGWYSCPECGFSVGSYTEYSFNSRIEQDYGQYETRNGALRAARLLWNKINDPATKLTEQDRAYITSMPHNIKVSFLPSYILE